MSNRGKREMHRALSRVFGSPTDMGLRQRRMITARFSEWIYQSKDGKGRDRFRWEIVLGISQRGSARMKESYLTRAIPKAMYSFPRPKWHWKIDALVKLPTNKDIRKKLMADSHFTDAAPDGCKWDYMNKDRGKRIQVVIPVNYHLCVPEGLRLFGKKIVQRTWNHRVYTDKEVWECTYWDFSGLSGSELSWTKAKWCMGFIVKMDVALAIEPTLSRAVSIALSRTVRKTVNSILSDVDENTT